MATTQKSEGGKDNAAPNIAPPLVILICIAGAAAVVIAAAALYRICRRGPSEDIEGGTWNPNKRNREQDKYMEEVRWRNNAFAWERAKDQRRDYRRGWFKEELERQRAREQGGWTSVGVNSTDEDGGMHYDGQEISPEEFLTHAAENPYQELLEQRAGVEQSHRESRFSPGKSQDNARTGMLQMTPEQEAAEIVAPPQLVHNQVNNTGVRITVNDESDDIVDQELPSSNKFSSSNYALKENKASRVRQEIDDWEQRNLPH
ncbi:hypothetical protein OHC33_004646 [Knufia fluminis]|uniref:Uncharacterized protein n=1 Tax=Knufia fluminis TaxID=191047 RepID=A0AAN8EQY9_9EURO|nr:hypothetical protein OHC33_004646 [Knufia fluminis]